jgi:hypothetical protein
MLAPSDVDNPARLLKRHDIRDSYTSTDALSVFSPGVR